MVTIIQTLKAEDQTVVSRLILRVNYDHHKERCDFVDTMFSYAFIPLITNPTGITPATATLIDIIIVNRNKLKGVLYTNISDHLSIFVLIKLRNSTYENTVIETRLYNDTIIAIFKYFVDR